MSRPPVDDVERAAVRGARVCCGAASAEDWACTRAKGHAGDHVAGDGHGVCDRWPQVTAPVVREVTGCEDCPVFAKCYEPVRGVPLPTKCPLRAAPVLVRLKER